MSPKPSCILLDIEGTTTPIDFVYQVLFPFARTNVNGYLSRNWTTEEMQADLTGLRQEHTADLEKGFTPPAISEASVESIAAYVHWLMDQDRKSTPLKSLQGRIWEEGYRAGELLSQIFEDVPPALEHWHKHDKQICIYSSGSVLAQRLLFGHTTAGDLTPLLSQYFDTAVGAKQETTSYYHIAEELKVFPEEILFLSDVVAELNAAQEAGLRTILSLRPGNHPQPAHSHDTIHSFAELF